MSTIADDRLLAMLDVEAVCLVLPIDAFHIGCPPIRQTTRRRD
jgi:hypothetical protein